MAITYAWRLDANKYSYLINPEDGTYGYATETPLTGNNLNMIATSANEQFGKDADNGLEKYVEAFNAMLVAIEEQFPDMKHIDLLSADVYYDVDAANCADLRGVGIKGVKYLGGITPREGETIDWANPIWNTNAKQGAKGSYDIYGIFMEDQDESVGTPSNIFGVYNGADGAGADVADDMYVKDAEYDEDMSVIQAALNAQSDAINELASDVSDLLGMSAGELNNKFELFLETVNQLTKQIEDMQAEIYDLKEQIESIGTGGSGGNISVEPVNYENEEIGGRYCVALYNPNRHEVLYYDSEVAVKNGGVYTEKGFYQKDIEG